MSLCLCKWSSAQIWHELLVCLKESRKHTALALLRTTHGVHVTNLPSAEIKLLIRRESTSPIKWGGETEATGQSRDRSRAVCMHAHTCARVCERGCAHTCACMDTVHVCTQQQRAAHILSSQLHPCRQLKHSSLSGTLCNARASTCASHSEPQSSLYASRMHVCARISCTRVLSHTCACTCVCTHVSVCLLS